MTTPEERTRAIVEGQWLLLELTWANSVPASIKQRAQAILRHHPLVVDVAQMADDSPRLLSIPDDLRSLAFPGDDRHGWSDAAG